MRFVDYLTEIAPEGETLLLVRQRPSLKDGQLQYYKDGAVKCTWPSFLPSRYKPDPTASWYANTASFIVERFVNGRVSASAVNCERVAFLLLDDVGTKAKVPPIEPTWKMETSPGNFQWCYTFRLEDQPRKGEFSAAIIAIAKAGYTDAGAINPVRNFRLPGSVNLKPEAGGFAAVLHELHEDREFSLPQICAALGVTPAPADTAGFTPLHLLDDGKDEVLKWLADAGLVAEPTNAEGWAGVVCPNASEHSDGNPVGRYNPTVRAYHCFHSHCGDWNSERFLRWVEEEGGPKCGYGLRDTLLAERMAQVMQKIAPTEAYPDKTAEVVAEVEKRQQSLVERKAWFTRFAYVQNDDSFFDLEDRRELSRSTFNALYRGVPCASNHNGRRIEASVYFDENRSALGAHALVGITYAAGDSVLVARDGLAYGNRWRNARPVVASGGDPTRWLDHMELLIPEPFEREHLLNVMAFKVQNPAVKINHAVLFSGDPGVGKDTAIAPFFWAVCGPSKSNYYLVKAEELAGQWGYSLECEIMEISELRQSEARDRRALENLLKPIIAAPPEFLTVNRKGLAPYLAPNRLFVLAFSNVRAAISIPSDDRRWFVLWTDALPMPDSDAQSMWRWYREGGGYEAVATYLHARDVSAFNPAARPPMTEAKALLIEHGMSSAESYLVDMIRGRSDDFARGVISSPFHAVCDRLSARSPGGKMIHQQALLHSLKEAGWADMGRLASSELTTRKHVFCAPEFKRLSKSDLRRMAEPSVAPSLSVVKPKQNG